MSEKEILWKFRFFISSNKKALLKFLRCIDWNDPQESQQAIELMKEWQPIDVDDALGLLSSTFKSTEVRSYAVSRMEAAAKDDELISYLLQLVQAMRYEQYDSHLVQFLIKRSVSNFELANFLYWYLKVETEDPKYSKLYTLILSEFENSLSHTGFLKIFEAQKATLRNLEEIQKQLKVLNINRVKKIAKLREFLTSKDFGDLSEFGPLALPIDPRIQLTGAIPETCFIFVSFGFFFFKIKQLMFF